MTSFFRRLLGRFFERKATEPTPKVEPALKISPSVLIKASEKPSPEAVIVPYEPPPGVVPQDVKLAMDSNMSGVYSYANQAFAGMAFPGYPHLAELSQRPEYRKMSETIAKELTRKWIKLQSKDGDKGKADKLKVLEAELKRYNVRSLFRDAAELDGLFGRAQIYIDVKTPGGVQASRQPDELKTILLRSPQKIVQGSLIGFKLIEPMWTYPGLYNADDPLNPTFFKPNIWFVMGRQVHASRLLTFVSRPLPDMLKAAYNFSGLSLSQMAIPYVDNWIRTRDSVGDLVHSFSVSGIMTDMQATLKGDPSSDLFTRMDLFNKMRDNRGIMALNKDSEEFFQFNTPLSGVDALQAQAQEQMASVSSIPLVKLLGITPSGLNASSDGEIRVFYDHIHALQEDIYAPVLKTVLEIIQLSKFGEIDPDIEAVFLPLLQMDDEALARIRKSDADAGIAYLESGVISPEEERERLANAPESGYAWIDAEDLPEPPDEEIAGLGQEEDATEI
jgi:uncharacterized protein